MIADPEVSHERVFDAAHEIARHIPAGAKLAARSLFGLAVGDGHSWSIAERQGPAARAGQRFETITDAALPTWRINGRLNLLDSEAFAADVAIAVLRTMVSGGGPADAKQVALATFDRFGFKAPAMTMTAVASSMMRQPDAIGIERTARLRFDHPFAAIAVSGRPGADRATRFRGLPLFEAWVDSPVEATS